jgi:hypothetical protein
MAKVETYICDVCGKDRREDSNRWRIFSIAGERGLCVYSIHEQGVDPDAHVCGNECATKLFQRWLTTGKLTQ